MLFKTWFTKTLNDGTVKQSRDVLVLSQDSFTQFLDASCAAIFGSPFVPELRASDYQTLKGCDALNDLCGSCSVRLTIYSPSKEKRHPVASGMTFHWESAIDSHTLQCMQPWLDDSSSFTNKTFDITLEP